jgi:Putative phage tail protein
MATLVLTVVGSAVGGPVGGAIGAAIGQQIDNIIFAPKARQGPRLKELAVQTSSYGTQIPAIFGAMRVAGTVIWATDLIERRAKSGGGKGRPAAINYSYSVSIAVALSSRPIARVGRIWADGNLLRGGAGDLKVDTQLRIYSGHDDQPLDPLMASAEQAGQCPAHRGIAYAVFEDLQLADYGNRIPSLTFEIFERDGAVPISAIFEAATGGGVEGSTLQSIRGFAVSGASASEPLAVLLDTLPLELGIRGAKLCVRDRSAPTLPAGPVVPVIDENGTAFDRPSRTLNPAAKFPHEVTLRYYDSDRDFQASLQSSERGPASRNTLQIELPAVLNATEAKQIVDSRHLQFQNDRKSWRGDIALGTEMTAPGDCFVGDDGMKWCIEQTEHRFGSVGIFARPATDNVLLAGQTASPGRNLPSPDLTIGETRMAAIEMPLIGIDDPGKPIVAVFAAGTGSGWRRAALSLVAGESRIDIGITASSAIIGTSLDGLSRHNLHLIDERAGVRVQLLNSAMDIADRAGSPLDDDAPYFWLGGEFIRCGRVEALGGGIYRLSRLRRGGFQSGGNTSDHIVGTQFVLLEPDSARLIEERAFVPGEVVTLEAMGLADGQPISASMPVTGLAIRPLAPVHGRFNFAADGSVNLGWIRRSRIDSGWRDGVDQVLTEQQEQYLIRLTADGATVGEWTSFESSMAFSAAHWAAFGFSENTTVAAEIRQVGRYAQSEPLIVSRF